MRLDAQSLEKRRHRREQGISKAGNRRARHKAIELAWLWLRHQGDTALSRWFRTRTADAGNRAKRIAIVALARNLIVALCRYLTTGLVPERATRFCCLIHSDNVFGDDPLLRRDDVFGLSRTASAERVRGTSVFLTPLKSIVDASAASLSRRSFLNRAILSRSASVSGLSDRSVLCCADSAETRIPITVISPSALHASSRCSASSLWEPEEASSPGLHHPGRVSDIISEWVGDFKSE
ncbi:hypothetical protein [Bradyrhizobium altum]|uniref:hypothetical protein n=1 Tax=Bradyrhizobium altum TaxID=1571202 RepID=UPI001E53CE33|nr:hypothetical protein [Bradyrhizobium altum]